MNTKSYNRIVAINYAKKWALSRNPRYYNFENGWFYNSGYNKSPSWSGVEYLYKFLTKNKSYGPRGKEVSQSQIQPGDIAQLSFDGNTFGHSLFIIDVAGTSLNDIFVATHTYDALDKKISEYNFSKIRFIHIVDIGI